ncbi:hypothetical protein AAH994_04755 [Weeksellaceae bacterium A-14]|uniref:hypothetical protein n=1 Tax=Daejeonia sp. YH14 TaxID=3439042 RepID=UPI0031E4B22E
MDKERLQKYGYDDYTVVTNFATYEDAVAYASENGGDMIEIGFTDGHDTPVADASGNLTAEKRAFKVILPGETDYEILYSDSEGFQEWAKDVLELKKKLDKDVAPEDWLADQNIAPGDRIIVIKNGTLSTVTTRERIKYLMRGNLYEIAVKVQNTDED